MRDHKIAFFFDNLGTTATPTSFIQYYIEPAVQTNNFIYMNISRIRMIHIPRLPNITRWKYITRFIYHIPRLIGIRFDIGNTWGRGAVGNDVYCALPADITVTTQF